MQPFAIKNGTIIDGTGAPPYEGDLVLAEEKITEGIKYVWVNGEMVIEHGKRTLRRPGKVLKHKNAM